MYIQTLKRMMIGRTIIQKGETVSVSIEEGQALLDKGDALALKTPDPADTKAKLTKTKPSIIKNDTIDNTAE